MSHGLLIAAERSGTGKTMITACLARALMNRGLAVQCFKVGPDFIDPGYHTAVTGRISRNLDGWMMGRNACRETFQRSMQGAAIGMIEGVMGLFDGLSGAADEGSSAQIAKWLGLPVILIIDGSSFSRSAGAVALGFERFDPEVHIAGIIFNKVGSPAHYDMLRAGVQEKCRAEVLGYIPRDEQWSAPERHLGLVMAAEQKSLQDNIQSLARHLEQTVDVQKILTLEQPRAVAPAAGTASSGQTRRPAPAAHSFKSPNPEPRPTIAIARDEAFCFCYEDNIDLLRQAGAEILFFSPLHDARLPEAQGLYLPGGYPELHAAALSCNAAMRQDVLAFCRSGRPVYAECGGFLYLLESLTGLDGQSHGMAGVFPAGGKMLPRLQRLGYVEVQALAGHPFLAQGDTIRGHEFHYSEVSGMPPAIARTCRVARRKDKAEFAEGFRVHATLAGYMHLHFASQPGFAERFIKSCARARLDLQAPQDSLL